MRLGSDLDASVGILYDQYLVGYIHIKQLLQWWHIYNKNNKQYLMQQRISLIQAQKEALLSILDPPASEDSPWKILVFDTPCQNILSTLYNVGDLRELYITLHLNLSQKREKLHGVRAIYLVRPSEEAVAKIVEDFERELYTQVILNFASPVPEELLEALAKGIGRVSGAAQRVEKVCEHRVDFTTLNHNLFTFNMKNVYAQRHKPLDQLAGHLYSIVSTLKVQPVIIYQVAKNKDKGAKSPQPGSLPQTLKSLGASGVAQALIQKLQNDDIDPQQADWPTMVVLILDREDDLNPIIVHSNTYAALMHDISPIRNNKVVFQNNQYDLSPVNDQIWAQSLNLPYPEVTKLLDSQLLEWKSEYDKVIGQGGSSDQVLNNMLSSAIDLVPQLQGQKRIIDQHMNIASQILQHAKQRQLDKYYQAGLGVIQLSQGFLQSCKETMGSEYQRQGTDEAIEGLEELRELDKARLLILLLLNSQPSSQFYEEFVRLEQGMGLRSEKYKGAIAYVKEKVRFGAQTAKSDAKEGQYRSMFMGLASRVRTHSKGLLQNVSTFLPLKEKKYAVVSLMENMFDDLRGQDYMDLFKIYDHRTQQILQSDAIQLSHIKNVLCFFLEGACFNEYAEIADFAKLTNRNIIYGSSEILNAKDLLDQFASIAKP